MTDDAKLPIEPQAASEDVRDSVVLWQDHVHSSGYRPTLRLLTFGNGSRCLELSAFGRVTRTPYTFPFLERDRL